MPKLKWQRVADSGGTTIMYTAVAGQSEPRQPYYSYRILPFGTGSIYAYSISLWRGEDKVAGIGSVDYGKSWTGRERRGEYRLADAKRAAQAHHNSQTTSNRSS